LLPDTGKAVLSGGTGIMLAADRIMRRSVVDFLNLGVGPARTGIFNVADLAITIGIVLVVSARQRVSLR
jgi:signal peptidase II